MEVTINIDGQALSVEVTVEVYEYLDRADHKEENLAHEKRRHWDSREFDEYIILTEGRSCYYQTPEQWVCRKETMLEIKAALALCTEAQRRRFLLYALEGLSYAEIAGLCRCSKAAIQDSIEAVLIILMLESHGSKASEPSIQVYFNLSEPPQYIVYL